MSEPQRRVLISRTEEFELWQHDGRSCLDMVKDVCARHGYLVTDMSTMSAKPYASSEACRQMVAETDLYLGLIGFRYGSLVDDDADRSYTELEYDTARSLGRPQLIFLLHPEAAIPPVHVIDNVFGTRQEEFRKRVEDDKLVHRSFKNPENLALEVGMALADLKRKDASHLSPQTGDQISAYLNRIQNSTKTVRLPLAKTGEGAIEVNLDQISVDLPLFVVTKVVQAGSDDATDWYGSTPAELSNQFRISNMSATIVDRAARKDDQLRECDIFQWLQSGRRAVVVGDPGSGKSTLLQSLAHRYSRNGLTHDSAHGASESWLPVRILCRDLNHREIPGSTEQLLEAHYGRGNEGLVESTLALLSKGAAMLLIDGLDEIANTKNRQRLASVLRAAAENFPDCPIVVTSRVSGYDAVADILNQSFDQLVVGPLDREAKRTFVRKWGSVAGWSDDAVDDVAFKVTESRTLAKLSDNILMLAMLAPQLHGDSLPGERRVDLYRSAVRMMIERQRDDDSSISTANEIVPHLEYLAHQMREQEVITLPESDVVQTFAKLRSFEPDRPILQQRSPVELVDHCISRVGILSIAGTMLDARGYDQRMVQFLHQSFQEYLAGQAIRFGRGHLGNDGNVLGRLGKELSELEIASHEVELLGRIKFDEPVVAPRMQELLRLLIADLNANEADDAIQLLLPSTTTRPAEDRPRSTFALQCLADEPRVSTATFELVVDAAIDNLSEFDGMSFRPTTRMDEALVAVVESRNGAQLIDRLMVRFAAARGSERADLGQVAVLLLGNREALLADDATPEIDEAIAQIQASDSAVALRAGLRLTDLAFATGGKLGTIPPELADRTWSALSSALEREEPVRYSALWATMWLSGSRLRGEESRSASTLVLPGWFTEQLADVLKDPHLHEQAVAYGTLSLTRHNGETPVFEQRDWSMDLARVADGELPRRDLKIPRAVVNDEFAWLVHRVLAGPMTRLSATAALALSSVGQFHPDFIDLLSHIAVSRKYVEADRWEAAFYLAASGLPAAVAKLVEFADTAPDEDGDLIYVLGILNLIYLDDVDVLQQQMNKALPHSDLSAYANGLAGSNNPKGRRLLEAMRKTTDPRIKMAAEAALDKRQLRPVRRFRR